MTLSTPALMLLLRKLVSGFQMKTIYLYGAPIMENLDVIQIKKLGWGMYHAYQYLTTDASHVRKAMKEWYNYINFELNKQEKPIHHTKADVEAAMAEIEEKSKAFTEAHKGETAEEILAQMRGEVPVSKVWHDAGDKPEINKVFLLRMVNGEVTLAQCSSDNCYLEIGEMWAYVDDLLKL